MESLIVSVQKIVLSIIRRRIPDTITLMTVVIEVGRTLNYRSSVPVSSGYFTHLDVTPNDLLVL